MENINSNIIAEELKECYQNLVKNMVPTTKETFLKIICDARIQAILDKEKNIQLEI